MITWNVLEDAHSCEHCTLIVALIVANPVQNALGTQRNHPKVARRHCCRVASAREGTETWYSDNIITYTSYTYDFLYIYIYDVVNIYIYLYIHRIILLYGVYIYICTGSVELHMFIDYS